MQPKSAPYLTTLTPIRGIASLIVVIFHCHQMFVPFVQPGYTFLFNDIWIWVDYFFVLSGFIMCYAYNKHFYNSVSMASYKKYIGARFARIYPLYFITTIWAFICSAIIIHTATYIDPFTKTILNLKALPSCLVFLQSMHLYYTPPLNTPSWSLSTEWWVYVIFPFLAPLFIKLKNPGKLITAILIVALYIFIRYVAGVKERGFPTTNVATSYGFLRCLAGFLTGMLLYTFFDKRAGENILKRDWVFIVIVLGLLATMYAGLPDIIALAFMPFILIATAYNQGGVKRFLDIRALQRLGDWSFSIYMVHIPIIFTFAIFNVAKYHSIYGTIFFGGVSKATTANPIFGFGAVMCLVVLILTVAIAALTYRYIEIPGRNFFNKIFDTRRKQRSADSVEV